MEAKEGKDSLVGGTAKVAEPTDILRKNEDDEENEEDREDASVRRSGKCHFRRSLRASRTGRLQMTTGTVLVDRAGVLLLRMGHRASCLPILRSNLQRVLRRTCPTEVENARPNADKQEKRADLTSRQMESPGLQ